MILAGDDRQLASIERGGMFAELRKAHGAAEITEVTRQTTGWQRQAARDLAEGRFDAAVQAFDRNGAVTWAPDQDAARSRWSSAGRRTARPSRTRAGSCSPIRMPKWIGSTPSCGRYVGTGANSTAPTSCSRPSTAMAFALGDRVQFTDTAKKVGIYNGNAGIITAPQERLRVPP